MLKEFQHIFSGDFSEVIGLRSKEEREEIQKDYREREGWEDVLRDMNGDNIKELCIKDSKGRDGIIYQVWGGEYLSEILGLWTFGEPESIFCQIKRNGE